MSKPMDIDKLKFKLRFSNIIFDFWMRLVDLAEKVAEFSFKKASNIADKNAIELTQTLNQYPVGMRKKLQDYIEGVEES